MMEVNVEPTSYIGNKKSILSIQSKIPCIALRVPKDINAMMNEKNTSTIVSTDTVPKPRKGVCRAVIGSERIRNYDMERFGLRW
jgi:hypothetical protein